MIAVKCVTKAFEEFKCLYICMKKYLNFYAVQWGLLFYINDFITTTFSKFMHKIKEINKVIVKNYTLLKASDIQFQAVVGLIYHILIYKWGRRSENE